MLKTKLRWMRLLIKSTSVINAQNSVAKVGDKLARGAYPTVRGAKIAYTRVMNRMSNAIFNATAKYSRNAIIQALCAYTGGTLLSTGLSFIPALK